MHSFRNLLYIVQGRLNSRYGLTQALSLARNNNARLTIHILSPTFPEIYAEYNQTYKQALKNHFVEIINSIATELKMSDMVPSISIEVVTHKAPAIGVIQSVLKQDFDLVIKESTPDEQRSAGFNAIDMQLLRDCPCALWLCRPIDNHRQQIKVAVAIDPKPDEAAVPGLSVTLLRTARQLADSCSGELQIVSCRDDFVESELKNNVFIKISEAELNKQVEREKQDFANSLRDTIADSGITGDNKIHLVTGNPGTTIPEYVTQDKVDILVMGTVARTGIPGFFIGNTAENIVQQLSCSLLTLKPKGFVSPVKL